MLFFFNFAYWHAYTNHFRRCMATIPWKYTSMSDHSQKKNVVKKNVNSTKSNLQRSRQTFLQRSRQTLSLYCTHSYLTHATIFENNVWSHVASISWDPDRISRTRRLSHTISFLKHNRSVRSHSKEQHSTGLTCVRWTSLRGANLAVIEWNVQGYSNKDNEWRHVRQIATSFIF